MKVSLVQMNSIDDKAANLAQARGLVERAVAEERPDWVCLPECFDFLGGSRAGKREAAETIPGGPAYSMCQQLARSHGIFLHAGSILERIEGEERLHNTTVVFDREGAEVARYRKIHMFDITTPEGVEYRESASFKPGDAVVTYECEGVTVGCSICYDIRFRCEGCGDDRAAGGLHDGDGQGSLGSPVPGACDRNGDVLLRHRADGLI